MEDAGGRERWIIERAEKGRPGGPHAAPTGHWEQTQALGGEAGSFGMQNTFSRLSQESDPPPTPTLFLSPEGVASRGLRDLPAVAACGLAASPMGHLSVCLSVCAFISQP